MSAKNLGMLSRSIRSKDGLEIYAEAAGDPSKPHVVFVHGLGLSGIAWDAQFSDHQLMERIYAVRYDLRGHGRTGKPLEIDSWASQRFAEDFHAVVVAFNLRRPILAGWSYGCTPAVDIVNSFGPEYLSGIIYVGGLPYTSAYHIVTPWQTAAVLGLQQHTDPAVYRVAMSDYIKQLFIDPKSISLETQHAWVNTMLVQPRAILRRVLRREQDQTRFWNEGASTLPLLVIHGQLDNVCDHDALIAEVGSKFSDFQVESWQGVGHTPFLERKRQFNETVATWVEKIASRGPRARL